ncbi:anti-sigma factor family protein [Streptomyces sp. NPDC051569]|uniref:anti-sigma factor family protein n=1 Tax=Streptomyces sp. NPDC051569 TaxID=3365661 RepID=UPI00378F58EB
MSGTIPTPAEQHLGDRLAALVDGELGHDARERVLAHLATCAKCKAEADAQRRLKNVFAQAAPPPLSAGLLARLQGLPGVPPAEDDDGRGPFDAGRFGNGVFGVRTDGFGHLPGGGHSDVLPGGSGFRIHEVGRQEAERSPWRGRRFAFAAASAVSFAAMALGGTMPLGTAADVMPRGAGNSVTPLRAPGAATPAAVGVGVERSRRQAKGAGIPSEPAGRPATVTPSGMLQTQTLTERRFTPSVLNTFPSVLNRPSVLNGSSPAPLIRLPVTALQMSAVPATVPVPVLTGGTTLAATPAPGGLVVPVLPAERLASEH